MTNAAIRRTDDIPFRMLNGRGSEMLLSEGA